MTWEQTIKEYAKDAFEEGVKETARNNAISLLKETDLQFEVIAKCCALSLEEVLELKQSLQAEPVNS